MARLPDAWTWPDWAYVHADGTWGNRYDDRLGEYRVLYACTERIGGFLEPDLDAATIRMSAPRAFTQEVSRRVYEMTSASARAFGGVEYGSRLGDELANWAIFEPADLDAPTTSAIDESDPDLQEAIARFGLTLVDDA